VLLNRLPLIWLADRSGVVNDTLLLEIPPRDAEMVAVTPAVSAEIPCVDVVKLDTVVVPLSKPAVFEALNATDG